MRTILLMPLLRTDYEGGFYFLLSVFMVIFIGVAVWFIKWVAKNAILAERAKELEIDGIKNRMDYEYNMMAAQYENKILWYSIEQSTRAGYYEGMSNSLKLLINGELGIMANRHRGALKAPDKFEIVDGVDQMEKEELEGRIEVERQKAERWERIANSYKENGIPQLNKPVKDFRNAETPLTFISKKYKIEETEPGKYAISDNRGLPSGTFDRGQLIEGKLVQVAPGVKLVHCALPGCNNVKHTHQQTSYCSSQCRDDHKKILQYA